MAKIGRNEPCLCGSGMKFKKCCGLQGQAVAGDTPAEGAPDSGTAEQKTLTSEVQKIVQAGLARQEIVRTSGVLILFSTTSGDAWILEVTAGDALRLTEQGMELEALIEENPNTTLIEWSHRFVVKKGKFIVNSYKDEGQAVYDDGYPVSRIYAAMKGIRKRIPAHLAGKINVPLEGASTERQS